MTYKIITGPESIQGSDEWKKWRSSRITASEAPIIMGVSPWSTPNQLYKLKLGLIQTDDNFAMSEGRRLEPIAREAFIKETGIHVEPQVVESLEFPWMAASLDGLSDCGKFAVEIKCPGSKDHYFAKDGSVPEKYYPQLQHQMKVLGLDKIYYYSYFQGSTALLEVDRDDSYILGMIDRLKVFYRHLESLTEPELTEKDYEEITDQAVVSLMDSWIFHKKEFEYHEKEMKFYREALEKKIGKKNAKVGPVKISCFSRRGSIEYSKIEELKNVDLDKYRKPNVIQWRFTLATDPI